MNDTTINVEPLGSPPAEPPTGTAATGSLEPDPSIGPTDAPAPSSGGETWTDDDLEQLKTYVRMPYEYAALGAGSHWLLSDLEAKMIATPLSNLIPVSWVRAGGPRRSPLISAVTVLGIVVLVTRPRLIQTVEARHAKLGAAGDRPRPAAAPPGDDRDHPARRPAPEVAPDGDDIHGVGGPGL